MQVVCEQYRHLFSGVSESTNIPDMPDMHAFLLMIRQIRLLS